MLAAALAMLSTGLLVVGTTVQAIDGIDEVRGLMAQGVVSTQGWRSWVAMFNVLPRAPTAADALEWRYYYARRATSGWLMLWLGAAAACVAADYATVDNVVVQTFLVFVLSGWIIYAVERAEVDGRRR